MRKAVLSHIHWTWMCVCHKSGLLREWCWASHMANIRLRHTSRNCPHILKLILFSLFWVSSYPASIQETTWLEIQRGFHVQSNTVNDKLSEVKNSYVILLFGVKNDFLISLLLLLWNKIESRSLKDIVKNLLEQIFRELWIHLS